MAQTVFRPTRQLSAAADGAAFEATPVSSEGSPRLQLRLLGPAAADLARWRDLSRRLRILASLEHPGALRIEALDLEVRPPWVALAWRCGEPLADALQHLTHGSAALLGVGLELARVLAEAHRLGLSHGALSLSSVMLEHGTRPWLDLTGIRTGAEPGARDTSERSPFYAPERAAHDVCSPEADAWALGVVLGTLAAGEVLEAQRLRRGDHPAVSGLEPGLRKLLRALVADDPASRATAHDAVLALSAVARATAAVHAAELTLVGELEVPETLDALDVVGDLEPAELGLEPSAATAPAQLPAATLVETPLAEAVANLPPAIATRRLAPGSFLGRFELIDLLGAGGMGEVWRARDPAGDGGPVAIKVLHARLGNAQDRERFRKEARLLEAVRSPWIANLIEYNQDRGVDYLVVEYIAGQSLAAVADARGRLPERIAVRLVADLCRALADPHRRGIVHRDIKPDNVLLAEPGSDAAAVTDERDPLERVVVKLIDFGIARQLEQTHSLALTRTGTVMGSPHYMAPEQCGSGPKVGPAADVYALCATLFRLISGRTLFVDVNDALGLMIKHVTEAPPRLDVLVTGTSPRLAEVVARGLAKDPAERFADASELLAALEEASLGAASSIAAHPALPPHDPSQLLVDELVLELRATPQALWPWVADTDRLNVAVGLPPVEYDLRAQDPPGMRRFDARTRIAGLAMAWTEQPFEWLEGKRYAVLREFTSGPVAWYVHEVVLEPVGTSATRLRQRTRLMPRNLLGRTVGMVQTRTLRDGFERAYRRLEKMLLGELRGTDAASAFAPPPAMSRGAVRQLESALLALTAAGIPAEVVVALGAFVRYAADADLARIRPLALAARLGVDPDALVDACLVGASQGLLVLLWDVLCPSCRVASEVVETLRRIQEHGRCEVCRLDFDLDFARSVELIFRVHPSIRTADVRTWCIGGPAHAPHVVAQLRLAPGERLAVELELPQGAYVLRSQQVPGALELRVAWPAETSRLEATFAARGVRCGVEPVLAPDGQLLVVENTLADELLVRLERRASSTDALTAARACTRPRFRELFPQEVLEPGRLVAVQQVVLLATALGDAALHFERLGDVAAFELVQSLCECAQAVVERAGGAFVRTLPAGGFLAVFDAASAALRAALELQPALDAESATRDATLAIAVHSGPAVAATLAGQLDYFGRAPTLAVALPGHTTPGTILVSPGVAMEPSLDTLCARHGLVRDVVPLEGLGSTAWAVRLRAPR